MLHSLLEEDSGSSPSWHCSEVTKLDILRDVLVLLCGTVVDVVRGDNDASWADSVENVTNALEVPSDVYHGAIVSALEVAQRTQKPQLVTGLAQSLESRRERLVDLVVVPWKDSPCKCRQLVAVRSSAVAHPLPVRPETPLGDQAPSDRISTFNSSEQAVGIPGYELALAWESIDNTDDHISPTETTSTEQHRTFSQANQLPVLQASTIGSFNPSDASCPNDWKLTGSWSRCKGTMMLLKRWNLERDADFCCPFHRALNALDEVVSACGEDGCDPLWSSFVSWQCGTCTGMNLSGEADCGMCGRTRGPTRMKAQL